MTERARTHWLLLTFTLLSSPSRVRVSIWRKLKKNGALNLSQGTWILPDLPECRANFQEIADEIIAADGTSWQFESQMADVSHETVLIEQFNNQRTPEYDEFMIKCEDLLQELAEESAQKKFTFAELEENDEMHQRLSDWLEKIRRRDFFSSQAGKEAENCWQRCVKALETFAEHVYASAENGEL